MADTHGSTPTPPRGGVTKADFFRLETLVENVAKSQQEVSGQLRTLVEITSSQDRRITVAEQRLEAGENSRGSIRTRDLLMIAAFMVSVVVATSGLHWFVIELRVSPIEAQQAREQGMLDRVRIEQAFERGVRQGRGQGAAP